jgi:murein L,D-transpeptidase YcbB/YkuD
MNRLKTLATRERKRSNPILWVLLLVTGCSFLFHHAYQANAELTPILPTLAAQSNLERLLTIDSDTLANKNPIRHLQTIQKIYRQNQHNLLWLKGYQLSDNGEHLLQQLMETSADELFDYQYHLAYIQQRLYNMQTLPREAAALDIVITDAFISYALDALSDKLLLSTNSRVNQHFQPVAFHAPNSALSQDQQDESKRNNIVRLLKDNPKPQQLGNILSKLSPPHQQYERLRKAFISYQALTNDNRWKKIPTGPIIKLGDSHPQVKMLRTLLTVYGDYPLQKNNLAQVFGSSHELSEAEQMTFDVELDQALKNFQRRHGSEKIDGKLGNDTRRLLNISPNFRVRQIALNMKRWRELPRDLGDRYLWVNMTNFTLELINQSQTELSMKVIIGKTYRKTPVITESISTLVLNPHWNVPRRIALYDILPQAKKDPTYLTTRNIKVLKGWKSKAGVNVNDINWSAMSAKNFPYRLQQQPGRGNALGDVKFVLPNDQSIYLHDTSHPGLFNRKLRTLSSGCVRVEKPLQLAQALLQTDNTRWTSKRIAKTIRGRKTQYVKLPKPVPTYLFYQTTWVDDQGEIQFRDDIYDRDQVVHSRLTQTISL